MRKGWEHWNCSTRRREGSGGISSMCTNMWRKGAEKMEPDDFQVVPSSRTRNWEQAKTGSSLSGKSFSLWGWLKASSYCPGILWAPFLKIFKSCLVLTGFRWLCLSKAVALPELPSNPNYLMMYYFYYTLIYHVRANVTDFR